MVRAVILSRCHVEMMQTRAYPQFAERIERPARRVGESAQQQRARLVDACVNAHAGLPTDGAQLSNLLSILRMQRKNQSYNRATGRDVQTLRAYLVHLAMHGDTVQRRVYACRMLRKLDKASMRDA
jgi:hypothetical protein